MEVREREGREDGRGKWRKDRKRIGGKVRDGEKEGRSGFMEERWREEREKYLHFCFSLHWSSCR